MGECICNSCRNLQNIIGDEGEVGESACKFGFPSDSCQNCTGGECSESCSHFEADDENAVPQTVKCMNCGKELKKVFNDNDFGDVFCFECYLKK